MFFGNFHYFRLIMVSLLLLIPFSWVAAAEPVSPWYLEASVSHVDLSRNLSGFELEDDDIGWSFGVGYVFNPYFSLQANYHDFGSDYRVDDCPSGYICLVENIDYVDVDGVSFSALLTWPINDVFDVYGQLGIVSWDTHFQELDHDESDEDLMYGVGLGANFSSHWRMVLKHERFTFDAYTTSLGLVYKF